MGNRLSKIVTRTGDDGTTGLGDGSRVPKHSARIAALGDVDELNSLMGWLRAAPGLLDSDNQLLFRIQHDLFDLGGELAVPGHQLLGAAQVEQLEADLAQLNAELPPLKEFVLPAGAEATCRCHVTRSVARRAERSVWALASEATPTGLAAMYLNRLSDLLFVLARNFARRDGGAEVMWDRSRL